VDGFALRTSARGFYFPFPDSELSLIQGCLDRLLCDFCGMGKTLIDIPFLMSINPIVPCVVPTIAQR